MTLIVEDGTIVANANTFVNVTDVTAYATLQGNAAWAAAGVTAQEAAIIRAAAYLRNESRFLWRGSRVSPDQRMPWPRQGASEYRGPALPNNYISWRLKDAQCDLALREAASPGVLQPDLARGGKVRSEKVDVLETTYADDAPGEALLVSAMGLLAPLLLTTQSAVPVPYQATPTDPAPFQTPDAFQNGNSNDINDITSLS